MDWMLMPYRRYADFSGRSRRMEYWMFSLFQFLVLCAFFLLIFIGGYSIDEYGGSGELGALGYVGIIGLVIFALGSFIPSLAVTVRRLHDQDKSGWWILIQFVPYIGGLIMLVLMFIDGTRGENRFGPDPKADGEEFYRETFR